MTQIAALFEYSSSPENLQQNMKLKTMEKYIKTKQHDNAGPSQTLGDCYQVFSLLSNSAE